MVKIPNSAQRQKKKGTEGDEFEKKVKVEKGFEAALHLVKTTVPKFFHYQKPGVSDLWRRRVLRPMDSWYLRLL